MEKAILNDALNDCIISMYSKFLRTGLKKLSCEKKPIQY